MTDLVPSHRRIVPLLALAVGLLVAAALPGAASAESPEGSGALVVTPSPIVVPPTAVGGQSPAQTVTIAYEGEGEVNVKAVELQAGDSGDFFINGSNCGTLSNGQKCEAWLGLKPSSVGAKQTYLVVVFQERPVASFEVSGDAVEAELSFEPGSYDFGLQRANRESVSTTFTLENTGAAGVQTNNFEIVGPGQEAFWFGNNGCSGQWLEPGQTCSIQIWFYPRSRAVYEAELRTWVNGASFSATISGTGGAPVVEALENPVGFGTVTVGAAGTVRTVTLRNVGDLPETFFIGVLAGGDAASFKLLGENCTLVSLPPGGTCTAQVRFSPDSAGAKTAHLAFFGDGEGGMLIQLEGEGLAPGATLLPSSFDFGAVAVGGRSAAHAFVVRNGGAASLALERVALVGANVEQFAISGDGCTGATLEPGGECVVWTRFVPRSAGPKQATLRVSGPSATLTAALAGSAGGAGQEPTSHRVRRSRFVRGQIIDARKARFLHRKARHAAHRRQR